MKPLVRVRSRLVLSLAGTYTARVWAVQVPGLLPGVWFTVGSRDTHADALNIANNLAAKVIR